MQWCYTSLKFPRAHHQPHLDLDVWFEAKARDLYLSRRNLASSSALPLNSFRKSHTLPDPCVFPPPPPRPSSSQRFNRPFQPSLPRRLLFSLFLLLPGTFSHSMCIVNRHDVLKWDYVLVTGHTWPWIHHHQAQLERSRSVQARASLEHTSTGICKNENDLLQAAQTSQPYRNGSSRSSVGSHAPPKLSQSHHIDPPALKNPILQRVSIRDDFLFTSSWTLSETALDNLRLSNFNVIYEAWQVRGLSRYRPTKKGLHVERDK